MANDAPKRHQICVIESERGFELAIVGEVRNGFIRSYNLKKDGLFDKERSIHLPVETVYHITEPNQQAMASLLWKKIEPSQIWSSIVDIRKSILTGEV